jgi:hypothetical protein
MSSQRIMSSKKASNSPGLCPVKGQKPSVGYRQVMVLKESLLWLKIRDVTVTDTHDKLDTGFGSACCLIHSDVRYCKICAINTE